MSVGELREMLSHYPDYYPIYGHANMDKFDPENRFELTACKFQELDFKHYKEPILTLEFDVS